MTLQGMLSSIAESLIFKRVRLGQISFHQLLHERCDLAASANPQICIPSGGSSVVELLPSKQVVVGSSPISRSNVSCVIV